MEQNTKVSGFSDLKLDKGKEFKFGQMVLCMKVGGKIIKLMGKEDSFMLTEISMMDIGRMIKLMERELIVI